MGNTKLRSFWAKGTVDSNDEINALQPLERALYDVVSTARDDKDISLCKWTEAKDGLHYKLIVPSMGVYVTVIEYGLEMVKKGHYYGIDVLGRYWAITSDSPLSRQLQELIAPFKDLVAREREERRAAEQKRIASERERYIADLQRLVQRSRQACAR